MVAVLVLDPYSFELLLTMSRNCQNSVKDINWDGIIFFVLNFVVGSQLKGTSDG